MIIVTSSQLNSCDNSDPHIRLLPTHPHLVSADFIRLLPIATSAHPLITHALTNSPIQWKKKLMTRRFFLNLDTNFDPVML